MMAGTIRRLILFLNEFSSSSHTASDVYTPFTCGANRAPWIRATNTPISPVFKGSYVVTRSTFSPFSRRVQRPSTRRTRRTSGNR